MFIGFWIVRPYFLGLFAFDSMFSNHSKTPKSCVHIYHVVGIIVVAAVVSEAMLNLQPYGLFNIVCIVFVCVCYSLLFIISNRQIIGKQISANMHMQKLLSRTCFGDFQFPHHPTIFSSSALFMRIDQTVRRTSQINTVHDDDCIGGGGVGWLNESKKTRYQNRKL